VSDAPTVSENAVPSSPLHPAGDGLRQLIAEAGARQGAALAVVRRGEVLVDAWGGTARPSQAAPWERRTLVNVQSVTKSVVALCVALLVDRGAVTYDTPVAALWPEFAAGGKEAITVGDILSHQAGLNTVRERLELEDLYGGDRFVTLLAAMAPLYPPGEKCVYHALSFGYLVAEIVRRVDGRTVQRFIAEELAEPFGLEMYLGLPEEEEHRVAEIVPGDGIDGVMEAASQGGLSAGYAHPRVRATEPNTRAWRAAGVPAGGLHTDALSLARLYAGLADGGMLDGRHLLGRDTLHAALAERFSGTEAGFGWPMRFGAGFMLNVQGRFGPHRAAFGHTGWGGYIAFGDPETGCGIAFVSNEMLPEGGTRDIRERLVLDPVFELLATLKDGP